MASSRASSIPSPLVIPAKDRHTATLIFVHGLGDQGSGWADAVVHWSRGGALDQVKVVLPNAPLIPITLNGGLLMPGWFDIEVLDGTIESLRDRDDRPGILSSCEYLLSLIKDEIAAGIPSNRIVLGGFSQGGALALFGGLTSPHKLAGVIGLSSWLPLSKPFQEEKLVPEGNPNEKTPVLMCHGNADPLVPHYLGEMTHEILTGLGYDVDLKIYEGLGHSATLKELGDVQRFLTTQLPPLNA